MRRVLVLATITTACLLAAGCHYGGKNAGMKKCDTCAKRVMAADTMIKCKQCGMKCKCGETVMRCPKCKAMTKVSDVMTDCDKCNKTVLTKGKMKCSKCGAKLSQHDMLCAKCAQTS